MSSTRFSYLPLIAMLAVPFSTQCSNDKAPDIFPGSGGSSGSGGSRSGGSGGARSGGSGGSSSSTGGTTGSGGSSSSGGSTGSGGSSSTGGSSGSGGSGSGGSSAADAGDSGSGGSTTTPGDDGGTVPEVPEAPLCLNTKKAVGDDGLIDDFEDTDSLAAPKDGRMGDWWAALSPTTMATGLTGTGGPIKSVAGGQMGKGLRLNGTESNASGWGANLAVAFTGTMDCYDASAYGGVDFWIKGKAGQKVSVAVQTAQIRALSRDDVGFYRAIITLTATGKKETIRFSSLVPHYGAPPPFDATKTTALAFSPVLDPLVPASLAFDFTLDNVTLVK